MHSAREQANGAGLLKVIQSGQMRGLINNGSLSPAPLGLSVIVCTLAACVHLPPNLPVLNTPWGRLLLPSPGWLKRRPLSCGGSRGIPSQPVQMGPQRNMVPLRRAWDSGPEWMAEFAAINPWLPNYLIYQMHSRLLCNCGDANKHSHTNRESEDRRQWDRCQWTHRMTMHSPLLHLEMPARSHCVSLKIHFHIFPWVVSICFRNVLRSLLIGPSIRAVLGGRINR